MAILQVHAPLTLADSAAVQVLYVSQAAIAAALPLEALKHAGQVPDVELIVPLHTSFTAFSEFICSQIAITWLYFRVKLASG